MAKITKKGASGKWRSFAADLRDMRIAYDIFLAAYGFLIRLAALWNPKAKSWLHGRKHPEKAISSLRQSPEDPVVWIHCASLGEFEQGRPVLEAIRVAYPRHRILLSFFSPSGYEYRKRYEGADLVCYLPLDGRIRSRRFLDEVRPCLAIFVKYEHWYYYLKELQARGIPCLSVSAVFRPSQPYFRPWGGFWRRLLSCYERIFVQDPDSLRLLSGIGMAGRAEISGDSRFDRVRSVAGSPVDIPWMEGFLDGRPTLVAGSTWPDDEALLATLSRQLPQLVLVIAPHDIDPGRLSEVERAFPKSVRFSECLGASKKGDRALPESGVLVVDNIGLLSSLYRFSTIAYVGGGFNRSGIHNILEAAVYGVPVIFGPRHGRSREASELLLSGGGFSVGNGDELTARVSRLLMEPGTRDGLGRSNAAYVSERTGATHAVLRHIAENRLLTD
jgi:3-deoxy-D-manno-octulosonic-acid transferase